MAWVCHLIKLTISVAAMQSFPRVLFVTPVAFNPYTGGGATFSSLFTGWPRDRLATVHNDGDPTTNDICTNYYRLGTEELDFIEPFGWLRRRRRSTAESTATIPDPATSPKASLIARVGQRVLQDSVPERERLTPGLHRWIADFRPEVIYTILGSNGMMALIEQIRATFDLPLVVHIMDDWSMSAHRKGLFAQLERFRMNQWLRHFFDVAEACLAITPAMQHAYTRRYGRDFPAFQFTLDVERWAKSARTDLAAARPPEFLYIGSIFADAQLRSLIDCTRAIVELNNEGFAATLRIVSQERNLTRFGHLFARHPNISLVPSQFDEEQFFRILADADALLLPVNFDAHSVTLMRYSMPTKVPSYGSADTAQVQYARDAGWGHVIAERSMPALKAGLRRIVEDTALRQTLSAAARTASANHDAMIVRPAFQNVLRDAATHKTLR
jgi:glycosyltransferase involved in cell wall biosynthesis